jgi:FAD-dependent urate hydroxylase
MTAAEQALAAEVREELALLAYPDRSWVEPVHINGIRATDVLIVGGGQTGLACAHGLRRDGVDNIRILEAAPEGAEGVWESFARMSELRTPKHVNGMDFGQPALSVQRWFQARYGKDAWQTLSRIPRTDWFAYLRWYRATLALPVENNVAVTDIRPGPGADLLTVETTAGPCLARRVVLATGFDGAGTLRMPANIAEALPLDRYAHACEPIDFTRMRGARVGILGHGASAFDAAVAALDHCAASVDLCFRRAALPVSNPHRYLEAVAILEHFGALSDRTRWNVARHMRQVDQPPGTASFEAAIGRPGFRMHVACPWQSVALRGGAIAVTTPQRDFSFDTVICATGYALDLAARPELRSIAPRVALWRDHFQPAPEEANAELGAFPYLGPGFEFLPREAGDGWVSRVRIFNYASSLSLGPHATSISGHKHALPYMLRCLTRDLFVAQEAALLPGLRGYFVPDITVPEG